MSAYDRQLDRLETSLPPDPDTKALIQRVAAEEGCTPEELLASAVRTCGEEILA